MELSNITQSPIGFIQLLKHKLYCFFELSFNQIIYEILRPLKNTHFCSGSSRRPGGTTPRGKARNLTAPAPSVGAIPVPSPGASGQAGQTGIHLVFRGLTRQGSVAG